MRIKYAPVVVFAVCPAIVLAAPIYYPHKANVQHADLARDEGKFLHQSGCE